MALVPLARRRRGDVAAPGRTRVRPAARTPARAEGSALDHARSFPTAKPRSAAAPVASAVGFGFGDRDDRRGGAGRRTAADPPQRALARCPQPGDRRAHPQRRGHRTPARSTQKVATRAARATGMGRRVRTANGRASSPRVREHCSKTRPRSARASRRARWASRSGSRATKCARCSSASTGTSSTSGAVDRAASTSARPATLEERVTYEPVGLVAHVSAWNYPYFVGLNTIVPALLTGNAVLYKPSEHATLTGLRLVDLCTAPVFPSTSCRRSSVAGPTGAALVAADVDMVCFTGSYATGRPAWPRRSPTGWCGVQLELGGKDARLRVRRRRRRGRRARGRRGRVLQRRPVVQRDRARLRARSDLRPLRRRAGRRRRRVPQSAIPRPTRPTSVRSLGAEQLDVLDAQIADAVGKGARVLCGGERIDRPGQWFAADRARRRRPDRMAVMRDESFGPVDRRRSACATTPTRSRAWTTPSSGSARRCSRATASARGTDPGPARRRQRVLERVRSFERAAAVGRPAALGPRRVDVGVRRARVRARESLALAFDAVTVTGRAAGAAFRPAAHRRVCRRREPSARFPARPSSEASPVRRFPAATPGAARRRC